MPALEVEFLSLPGCSRGASAIRTLLAEGLGERAALCSAGIRIECARASPGDAIIVKDRGPPAPSGSVSVQLRSGSLGSMRDVVTSDERRIASAIAIAVLAEGGATRFGRAATITDDLLDLLLRPISQVLLPALHCGIPLAALERLQFALAFQDLDYPPVRIAVEGPGAPYVAERARRLANKAIDQEMQRRGRILRSGDSVSRLHLATREAAYYASPFLRYDPRADSSRQVSADGTYYEKEAVCYAGVEIDARVNSDASSEPERVSDSGRVGQNDYDARVILRGSYKGSLGCDSYSIAAKFEGEGGAEETESLVVAATAHTLRRAPSVARSQVLAPLRRLGSLSLSIVMTRMTALRILGLRPEDAIEDGAGEGASGRRERGEAESSSEGEAAIRSDAQPRGQSSSSAGEQDCARHRRG